MKDVIQIMFVAAIVTGLGSSASAINISTVSVGHPSNLNDTDASGTHGSVVYPCGIKSPITTSERSASLGEAGYLLGTE